MHQRLRWESGHLPLQDCSVDTVITDPPWSFDLRLSPRAKAVRATPYQLIPDADMPNHFQELYRVLRPGGHLFVFAPDQKVPELEWANAMGGLHRAMTDTRELGRKTLAWNTKRVASLIWVKTTKDGERVRPGLGHTVRMCHEQILFFSKGRRRSMQHHSLPSVLGYAREGGSVKPAAIYRQIALASAAPGSVVLDPWCGSDPLGRAELDGYITLSGDIEEAWGGS